MTGIKEIGFSPTIAKKFNSANNLNEQGNGMPLESVGKKNAALSAPWI